MSTNTFAMERLDAALDCLIAAGELHGSASDVAGKFNHRAYRLVTAALYSLKGEDDPHAAEPIY